MAKLSKDNLFILLKSLSQSEKRQFKLYVNRLADNVDAKFILLFNLLDKMEIYDEQKILESKIVTKTQLSNLKAHLYKQILISLRLNPVNQNVRIFIREQLDFSTILYNRGLYKQSLKILEKAKQLAIEHEEKNIAFEIIELEKVIESQYITRSMSTRADELVVEAKNISKLNVIASKLSNLSLQLYSIMLKSGYVRNEQEKNEITEYFNNRMPKYKFEELGFREKLWLYKAYVWYSFLTQDFLTCYKYSQKWIDLFEENPQMIYLNPVWYLKGNSYLLECLYLLQNKSKIKQVIENLEKTINLDKFPKNDNINSLCFLYFYNSKLNLFFLEGNFEQGLNLVDEVLKKIKSNQDRIDEHHVLVFYYKIACLYFGTGNNKKCIEYLNKIIDFKNISVREDLMCFARILSLIAHFEAGLDYKLELQIISTLKFLVKMNELHAVQKEIIKFLKNLGSVYPNELKSELKILYDKLKTYENDPFEKRSFLYLDILTWLESRIENKPINIIIKEKALKNVR